MAKRSVLGLYTEEDSAADALDNLRDGVKNKVARTGAKLSSKGGL